MFKCTGYCSRCGRCMNKNLDNKKADMLVYPISFTPDIGIGTGISFDIGTTTIAGVIWNLEEGRQLATASMKNPQGRFGRDVISRINFAIESKDNFDIIRQVLIDGLNKLVQELTRKSETNTDSLTRIVVCGNTAMSHIFAGYSPESLAIAPFKPVYEGTINAKASTLGLLSSAEVLVVPNIAGHVGGDITAGIVATEFLDKMGLHIFIDVGTNGEIVLLDRSKKSESVLTCSTAAGPAFEAVPGRFGSNVIDTLAKMLDMSLVDKSGKLRISEENLPPWAYLSQGEIRELQLAKGAIRAGIDILLMKVGKVASQLDSIVVAGSFGNNINPNSGIRIGLFPDVNPSTIMPAGNAASAGASMILTSRAALNTAEHVAEDIEHVELAGLEEFQKIYLDSMRF